MMKALLAFMSRHPWIFVVLAFVILMGAWGTIITLACKYGPEEIELESENK